MLKIEAKDSKNSVDNLKYVEPEIWIDIEGYEGHYQVSNRGRVKSFYGNKPKILKPGSNRKGYLGVVLYKQGKKKSFQVHRLVATAFVENPENKPQVNHKDGIKTHNYPLNLEWVTNLENMRHAYETGIRENGVGENAAHVKLTKGEVLEIRDKWENENDSYTLCSLADEYNVSKGCINGIVYYRRWTHL